MENFFTNHPTKKNLTILLVEDDESLAEVLTGLFSDEGYRIRCIKGADDILPLIDQFRPDLVLLDYVLPKVNGGELCSQIKKHRDFCSIPVIIYSAFSRVLLSLGDYGCDVFMEKPFDINDLLKKIEKLTARHSWVA
jgi:DNA-binding response OmpR family regulator